MPEYQESLEDSVQRRIEHAQASFRREGWNAARSGQNETHCPYIPHVVGRKPVVSPGEEWMIGVRLFRDGHPKP